MGVGDGDGGWRVVVADQGAGGERGQGIAGVWEWLEGAGWTELKVQQGEYDEGEEECDEMRGGQVGGRYEEPRPERRGGGGTGGRGREVGSGFRRAKSGMIIPLQKSTLPRREEIHPMVARL